MKLYKRLARMFNQLYKEYEKEWFGDQYNDYLVIDIEGCIKKLLRSHVSPRWGITEVEFNFANSTPEQLFLTVVYKHKLGVCVVDKTVHWCAIYPSLALDFTVEVGGNAVNDCTDIIKDYLTDSLNQHVR